MNENKALHAAVDKEDIAMFLDLLHQPDVDLNYRNRNGETPLTASIRKGNHLMVEHLIEAGCSVNLVEDCNLFGELSPLHVTFNEGKIDMKILQMLIQNGADINAKNNGETLLHEAVYCNNLEAVSLLLYYGADVNVTDDTNCTPFMLTFFHKSNCQDMLLNFYDDFSTKTVDGDTILHKATLKELPIVFDLIKRCEINCLDGKGKCLLYRTINHENAKIFKFIWSRIDHRLLLSTDNSNPPFLLEYLERWKFSNSEFLECLYLMLESPIGQNLIQECLNYRQYHTSQKIFMFTLLKTFSNREILLPKDRLKIICICLSLGAEIEISDLQFAYECYGFNEEFEALLHAGNVSCNDCVRQIRYCRKLEEDFYLKGFSSCSLSTKKHADEMDKIRITSSSGYKRLLKYLGEVPKFPSLLELARNTAQKFIQENFRITKLYQFYSVISFLKLPQAVRNILLLEKPIYNFTEPIPGTDDDSENDDCIYDDYDYEWQF